MFTFEIGFFDQESPYFLWSEHPIDNILKIRMQKTFPPSRLFFFPSSLINKIWLMPLWPIMISIKPKLVN